MKLEIRRVRDIDLKKIFKFRSSYIDMSYEDFIKIARTNLNLWFVAYDNDELIGYCLGLKVKNNLNYIQLDEIATNVINNPKYIRKGIGSKLIKKFENEVWNQGYQIIGLGCGDKYETEQFYLKNNYIPIQIVAGEKGIYFERVEITNYKSGKIIQKELHSKYDVKEVIFIFEKYFNDKT